MSTKEGSSPKRSRALRQAPKRKARRDAHVTEVNKVAKALKMIWTDQHNNLQLKAWLKVSPFLARGAMLYKRRGGPENDAVMRRVL